MQDHREETRDHKAAVRWARGLRTPFPADITLPEVFAEWVVRTPGAVAVIEADRSFTYAELDDWSEKIAAALRDAGVAPGARIGLPAVRSAAFVAAILGILKAGGAYLPLDEEEPVVRQEMRRADCHFVLDLPASGEALRVHLGEAPAASAAALSSESPAYVLYTSGSTGTPKGVVVPHRAIVRLVCVTDYLTLSPRDRFAFHSNLSFDASTLEIWGPLLNGGSLVVTPRETLFSAEALGEHLRRHGVTSLWLTTSLFAQLAQQAPGMFAGLRHLIFGGEAADPAAVRRVWEAGAPRFLINGYGPTETTTFAVCHRVLGTEGERIPIGRPIANTDAWVLDESGEPAEEGELWIGGPGLALGYLNAPELTARSFVETRWGRLYRTGDRARWQADGTLDFLGRADRQIKIRGFRIEPGEVEAAILRFPGVRQCAVRAQAGKTIGQSDNQTIRQSEAILAAYIAGAGDPLELRAFLQRELPAQMVPVAYAFLDVLPLTASGKLDEPALPVAAIVHNREPGPAAGTPLQRIIAGAWSRVLGMESVGMDENFFDLGGTSLSLLRLHAELRALPAGPEPVEGPARQPLRIVDLFQHPTVRTLAAFLESDPSPKPLTQAAERAARRRESMARRKAT
jgi:amino acid adenylation domain-containing protein